MKIHRRAEIGLLTTIGFADPAAGAGFNVSAPTNVLWRLNSLRFILTSDVTVGNRFVTVNIYDGTFILGTIVSTFPHPASVTTIYGLVDGFSGVPYSAQGYTQLPWRGEIFITSGQYLMITAVPLTAADQFSAIYGRAEGWIDD